MATLEEAIYTRCMADGTLSGLISTRLYPLNAPEGAVYPCVVYQVISGGRINAHAVSGSGATGLKRNRVQFTIIGTSYSNAVAVKNALIALWDAKKLTVTVGAGTVYIDNSFIDTERSDYGQLGENNSFQVDIRFLYRS
jgi:hypothetical protein